MEYKNNKTANRRRYKSRYHSPHNYKAKNPSSGKRAPILIGVTTFIVLAGLVLVFAFGDKIYSFLDNTFHPGATLQNETMGVTVLGTEEPTLPPAVTEGPTEAPTEAPTYPPVDQSDEFKRLLAAAKLSENQLTGSQMIFAESSGTSAKVYTYEKDDRGMWMQKFAPISGFVGEGGVSANVGPTDNSTPIGTFGVEYAMGTNPDPGTLLSYKEIYVGLRWVTDPASVNYNRLVDSQETEVDYSSCQELHEYTVSYPYAVILDYNRNPVDPAKGCAKFLHVSDKPTRGGVGIPESDLQSILLWLNPDLSPTVSIY